MEDYIENILSNVKFGIINTLEASYSHPRVDLILQHFNEEEIFDFTSNSFVRSEYFKFVAVAPLAFRFFRDFYGISYQSFQDSIASSTFVKSCSQRAFMLYPHKRFAMKALTKREFKTIKKILPAFYIHLTDKTPTVLPKYIGLYILEKKRKRRMFVLFDDYFPRDLFTPLETFSFRNRSSEEFLLRYPEGLLIKKNHRNNFFAIIENDVNFLERFQVIGYALQIKVCRRKCEEDFFAFANMFRGYNSCGDELFLYVEFKDCLRTKCCNCLLSKVKYSRKLKSVLDNDVLRNVKSESVYDLVSHTPSAPSIDELEPDKDSQMRLIIPRMKLDIIEEVEGEGDYDNIPMPKFGDAKSPSNVGDWLRIHEDIGIIRSNDCKVTRFAEEESPDDERISSQKKSTKGSRKSGTTSTSFSPKITRFAEEEEEEKDEVDSPMIKLIDTRKSFRNKSIKSDRTSVFSYGARGKSFRGSIAGGFMPSPLERVKSKKEEVQHLFSSQSVNMLKNARERAIAIAWVNKLTTSAANEKEAKLRNDFMYYLNTTCGNGELVAPFNENPPKGPLFNILNLLPIQSKQPKYREYFEYIDLALNDVDDQEENLLFSLSSILEAKRDIKEMMKMT